MKFFFTASNSKEAREAKEDFVSSYSQSKPVVIGSSKNFSEFFNYALEIAALKRVKSTVRGLNC